MTIEKLLVIGSDEKLRNCAQPFTKQLFAADENDNIMELVHSIHPQMILISAELNQQKVCDILTDITENAPQIPAAVLSHAETVNNEQQFMALGAKRCIKGRKDNDKLGLIINSIINGDEHNAFDTSDYFSSQCPSCVSIVGKSHAAKSSLKMTRIVAGSSCNPVLILGETGTGKELAARAVHIIRHGSEKQFVAVNCAALTANLLESELFGHTKGSFTSADREKTGLLELAEDGTIFLDEVSEMPLDLQAKLLRVVQEKTFRKVGGSKDIKCNATIITSSNRNLYKEVEKGKFRRDLYYRLAICPIHLAPLRCSSRRDDILLLADYFLKTSDICPEKKGKIKGMTKMAAQALEKHDWPGNVRELKNVIERAIILETTDKIGLSSLMLNHDHAHEDPFSTQAPNIKDFSLEKAEKELIAKALAEAGWQKTRAASMLGITRATLYAKVKQYDIKQPSAEKKTLIAS